MGAPVNTRKMKSYILHIFYILYRFNLIQGIFKRISNISFIFRLGSVGLYVSDLPRAKRLILIAKAIGANLTWDNLITFLRSNSELDQEFVAYLICGSKGYFVEFGALDGVRGSNTFLLETKYEWRGLLAEAIPRLAESCQINRSSPCCNVAVIGNLSFAAPNQSQLPNEDSGFVSLNSSTTSPKYGDGQTVTFATIQDEGRIGLSTISSYIDSDMHSSTRRQGFDLTEIPAISLLSLLEKYNAPKHINFLSIDTEGSEFDILSDFPFEKYHFDFICIEHNHSVNEESIKRLMMKNGYTQIMKSISGGDAFFVRNKLDKK